MCTEQAGAPVLSAPDPARRIDAYVAGQRGHLMQPAHVIYDDEFIDQRANVVQVAIDATRQPSEPRNL